MTRKPRQLPLEPAAETLNLQSYQQPKPLNPQTPNPILPQILQPPVPKVPLRRVSSLKCALKLKAKARYPELSGTHPSFAAGFVTPNTRFKV